MKFGTKSSEAPSFDGEYLRGFKKGETVVRFLQEPEDFTMFYEHFINGKSFPCTDDKSSCPGCTHDSEDVQRRSRKYAAMLYNVAQKYTAPHKLAVGLNNKMEARKDRNDGTILSRDFAVIKTGTGLSTDYDVDQEDKYELDTKKLLKDYEGSSIEKILRDSFEALWGDPDKYDTGNQDSQPTSKPEPAKKEEAKPDDDADVTITEAELIKMSYAELTTLFNKAGFNDFNEDWSKKELVEEIIRQADLPPF